MIRTNRLPLNDSYVFGDFTIAECLVPSVINEKPGLRDSQSPKLAANVDEQQSSLKPRKASKIFVTTVKGRTKSQGSLNRRVWPCNGTNERPGTTTPILKNNVSPTSACQHYIDRELGFRRFYKPEPKSKWTSSGNRSQGNLIKTARRQATYSASPITCGTDFVNPDEECYRGLLIQPLGDAVKYDKPNITQFHGSINQSYRTNEGIVIHKSTDWTVGSNVLWNALSCAAEPLATWLFSSISSISSISATGECPWETQTRPISEAPIDISLNYAIQMEPGKLCCIVDTKAVACEETSTIRFTADTWSTHSDYMALYFPPLEEAALCEIYRRGTFRVRPIFYRRVA